MDRPGLKEVLDQAGDGLSADDTLGAFTGWVSGQGIDLYPAQEEAVLELVSGSNVILNTPTGSGKSLVALALHFAAVSAGEISVYTAPTKALVSEKFFDLCRVLGAERVGMITGDATVNRDAPVLCCTAEILANMAMEEAAGCARTSVGHVVMDEFHFYSDPERGVAWELPLLCMPNTRFLLMSATLGSTAFFEDALTELNGLPTALVKSTERPVPLEFSYSEIPVQQTVENLVEAGKSPIYLVHFTQRQAAERAQDLMSINVTSKETKRLIRDELGGFRFDSPYGKELKRFVLHGIGVHHAGLLPKYRRMVERLAQKGLLHVICGTDTLGVGVNVPIRTVVLTQLCKYDGTGTRILPVRDFRQVVGRAGRRGFDHVGYVVAQAPAHVIENQVLEAKVADNPKKLKKLVRRKPPEHGYVAWDKQTFERLQQSDPEPLTSQFQVNHGMVVQLLAGGRCAPLKDVIRRSHGSRKAKFDQGRKAISLLRSLLEAGVLESTGTEVGTGTYVLQEDFQSNFAVHESLALWMLDALERLDGEDPAHALNVVTLVESMQEQPTLVLRKQLDRLKAETVAELKAEGVEYEERMAILEKLEYPKPMADFVYGTYNGFVEGRPWLTDNVMPKSVVRDMYEQASTFSEYVKHYGLQRSEGVLLRYLSQVYRTLEHTVPVTMKTGEVEDLVFWLRAVLHQVDSSLVDEWEALAHPDQAPNELSEVRPEDGGDRVEPTLFMAWVRNGCFAVVQALSRRDYVRVQSLVTNGDDWPGERLVETMAPYWATYDEVLMGPDARSPKRLQINKGESTWELSQVIMDPEENLEWHVELELDVETSHGSREVKLKLLRVSVD